MNNVVSMKWLLARLYEPDLVIVDCRFALGKPESGRAAYEESHIPRAVYLDLEKDLSSLSPNMADAILYRTWISLQSVSASPAFRKQCRHLRRPGRSHGQPSMVAAEIHGA